MPVVTTVRKAVALGDVEHRIAPQKRDRLRLDRVARRGRRIKSRLRSALLGHEPVSIADADAMFALANRSAERDGLPEGQPLLRGIAFVEQPAPKDQDVDPGIGPAGRHVARQADGGLLHAASPGLHPRHDALLEFGNDPVGDFFIKRRARPLRAQALLL
ncbi:hypothetical protein ACVIHD_002346 [Bradyrhizobium embrapense]